ncbi:MAG: hypothetical protein ACR2HG_05630 [Pyrinomonadaceae bacterium]
MRNYPFIEPTFASRTHQLAICQSIYDANAFNIRNWRDGFPIDYDMLPELVIKFLKLLEEKQVDFCIVGGIAYLAYIQDRNTKDLDILISVRELEKIISRIEVISQDANFINAEFEGMRIDFLKTSNSLYDYVKKNETALYDFVEGKYPIATVAGLVLMRFEAIVDLYQKGNFNKIVRYESDLQFLTMNYEIDWEHIWRVSQKFFTEGQISEFQKMIAEWQKPRVNPFLK